MVGFLLSEPPAPSTIETMSVFRKYDVFSTPKDPCSRVGVIISNVYKKKSIPDQQWCIAAAAATKTQLQANLIA